MSEEYLWDGQGEPDSRVAELESMDIVEEIMD